MAGLIAPVEIGPLHSVPGAVGLLRTAVGWEAVQNPPAYLFEGDFSYAWQRVGDSHRFEMNLQIPAGAEVWMYSLLHLSSILRDDPPRTNDHFCQIFDCAVDRLLRWFVALIEVDYRHIGLINPENIFVIQWSGWAADRSGEPINVVFPEPRDTRVILPDAGFLWQPGGALPDWLTGENPWKFIWGDVPENVYRRPFNNEAGYARVLGRLLAYLLEPNCGVNSAKGEIELTKLNYTQGLYGVAGVWSVLDKAIKGGFETAEGVKDPGSLIEAFRKSVATKPASSHFVQHVIDVWPPKSRTRWPLVCKRCNVDLGAEPHKENLCGTCIAKKKLRKFLLRVFIPLIVCGGIGFYFLYTWLGASFFYALLAPVGFATIALLVVFREKAILSAVEKESGAKSRIPNEPRSFLEDDGEEPFELEDGEEVSRKEF